MDKERISEKSLQDKFLSLAHKSANRLQKIDLEVEDPEFVLRLLQITSSERIKMKKLDHSKELKTKEVEDLSKEETLSWEEFKTSD